MTEQLFLAAFIFILGAQVGRVLTLNQQYRKTVEGITCLLNADWHVPQVMAARLHCDQDGLPDLPPVLNIWAPPAEPQWWMKMERQIWRAPRIRRTG
jgi:hypothetical protein